MYQINTVLCHIKVHSNLVGWLRKLQSSSSGLDQMMFFVLGVVVGVKFASHIVVLGLLLSSLAYHICTGNVEHGKTFCSASTSSNTIELTVHPSCYCVLDLLCVMIYKT